MVKNGETKREYLRIAVSSITFHWKSPFSPKPRKENKARNEDELETKKTDWRQSGSISLEQAEKAAEEIMLAGGSALMILPGVHGTLTDQMYRVGLALASGKTSKGHACRKGLILYVDGCGTSEFIAYGLRELREGKPHPKNFKIIPTRGGDYTLEDIAKHVNRNIYDLLIIDPLWAFLPLEAETDNRAMRDALMTIEKIKHDTGTAVICVCHRGNVFRPDDYPKSKLRKSG